MGKSRACAIEMTDIDISKLPPVSFSLLRSFHFSKDLICLYYFKEEEIMRRKRYRIITKNYRFINKFRPGKPSIKEKLQDAKDREELLFHTKVIDYNATLY
jgi:hypothetical protein